MGRVAGSQRRADTLVIVVARKQKIFHGVSIVRIYRCSVFCLIWHTRVTPYQPLADLPLAQTFTEAIEVPQTIPEVKQLSPHQCRHFGWSSQTSLGSPNK